MIQDMWSFCWTAVLARHFWKSYKLVCIKVQVASFRRNGQWFIRELSPLVLYSALRHFSAGSPILPTNHQKWSLNLYGDLAASIWVTFNQFIWFVALLISHVSSRFVMMVMTIRPAKQSTTSKDTWGKPIRVTTISLLFIRIDCQHVTWGLAPPPILQTQFAGARHHMEKKTQFLAVHFAWQATVITNECRAGVVLRTLVSHQCSPRVQVPYPASYVGLGLGFACSLLCT